MALALGGILVGLVVAGWWCLTVDRMLRAANRRGR